MERGCQPKADWGLYFAAGKMYEINLSLQNLVYSVHFGFAEIQSSAPFGGTSFPKEAFSLPYKEAENVPKWDVSIHLLEVRAQCALFLCPSVKTPPPATSPNQSAARPAFPPKHPRGRPLRTPPARSFSAGRHQTGTGSAYPFPAGSRAPPVPRAYPCPSWK